MQRKIQVSFYDPAWYFLMRWISWCCRFFNYGKRKYFIFNVKMIKLHNFCPPHHAVKLPLWRHTLESCLIHAKESPEIRTTLVVVWWFGAPATQYLQRYSFFPLALSSRFFDSSISEDQNTIATLTCDVTEAIWPRGEADKVCVILSFLH